MTWIFKKQYNKTLPRGIPTIIFFEGSLTFLEAIDKLGVSGRLFD